MEEELLKNEEQIQESVPSPEPEVVKDESVKFDWHNVIEVAFYILGAVFIILCLVKYGADLNTYGGEFLFSEKEYVGGDAYNYIISASRSTTVMVKSLIFAVLGSSSIISGLLVRIASKK